MKSNEEILAVFAQKKAPFSRQLALVWKLSVPAILAQITSVAMQYIDAAMVGSLGANASAAIGVVSTSMWVVYGVSHALGAGFAVQVAQAFGADDAAAARKITKNALAFVFLFSLAMGAVSVCASFRLPRLLGASPEIWGEASAYFLVFGLTQPFVMLASLGIAILQSSGNMKLPSVLSALTCLLDVLFNAIFIFPTRQVRLGSFVATVPGAGLGVTGAALGSALSEMLICAATLFFLCVRSQELGLRRGDSWFPSRQRLVQVAKISIPMAFERLAMNGAQVVGTGIVAPLGTVALASHSFATTAEAICYMPGYGVSRAATTLTGQSLGAGRPDYAKHFAWLSEAVGVAVMTVAAAAMYVLSPRILAFLTPVEQVRELGVAVLRIQLVAEPLFAASIVAIGAFRGIGSTVVPGVMNLVSMWGVRLPLAFFWAQRSGLRGVWLAMCVELCFRGVIFLAKLYLQKWEVSPKPDAPLRPSR